MDAQLWNWALFAQSVAKIAGAYFLTLPMGYLREKQAHSAGIRTFPIVAMASCGYVLVAQSTMDPAGVSRLMQGLIAGIGFVGGGAIVKERGSAHGTAAAASIWNTGAIGSAVALGRFEIAVILAIVNTVTLVLFPSHGAANGQPVDTGHESDNSK
jgi:putative Mg2+ transporter-C (MgtC) family protein